MIFRDSITLQGTINMTMGFGWNYPPGMTSKDWDYIEGECSEPREEMDEYGHVAYLFCTNCNCEHSTWNNEER
jgi:hypothetical protein